MKNKLLFAFLAFVLLTACTKISNTEIGNGLIPPIDGINTKDTFIDINTYNIGLDSIRISKFQEMALGFINADPVMGQTTAIINAEFKPQFYPYYFEVRNGVTGDGVDSLRLDSVVLVLGHRGYWGDTANDVSLKVFEISQSSRLKTDSVYSNNAVMNRAGELGSAIVKPFRIKDSIKPNPFNEQAVRQIRIKLSNAFGNRLLKEFDSSNAYQSEAQFSSTFRGFSIVPQSGNTLFRVSLSDTNSKLALYYKYRQRNNVDTTVVRYFRPGTIAGASNNIVRNRVGTDAGGALTNPQHTPDTVVFLQAGPGGYVRIQTPGLTNISNRLVHRAELIMEQEADNQTSDELFTAPNLFLCAVQSRFNSITNTFDSARRFYVPNDVAIGQGGVISNLGSFGGFINYKNDPNGRRIASYSFNITRYVQGIITRKEKVYDLYLFAPVEDFVYGGDGSNNLFPIAQTPFNPPAIGRVKLFGGTSKRSDRKMRLRIIYSNL